jgi:heat shock protein HslJ
MNRWLRVLGVAIASAVLLGACSVGAAPGGTGSVAPSAAPPTAAPSTAAAATVDGKTYLSTAIKGATLVPGTQIRLTFKDGNLSASGGCNSMGGRYSITGGRLVAAQLLMTEMGCDEPRMRQDAWLAQLLGAATVALTGETLTVGDGTIELTLMDREVASPDKPIDGTRWILDGIVSGDTASSVPAGVTASLRLGGGGVEVEAGCNTGAGTVGVTVDTLTVGPIALTKMACAPAAMSVERAFTAVLTGSVSYSIDADVLTIGSGARGLTFRAAP